MLLKNIKTLMLGILILSLNSACQRMSFERVAASCEAPNNSARFGIDAGPLITEPKADSLVPGLVTVRGTCVSNTPVSIQDSSGQIAEVNCRNESFSAQVELTGEDGLKSLSVSQNSAKDGSAMADRLCFMKDGTPPAVGITNGNSSQSLNEPISVISGYCEDGLTVLISGPGLISPVETSCNNGAFSSPVQTVPGDGIKDIQATQIDFLGNQGKDIAKYTIDSQAPLVRITSPAAGWNSRNTILLGGTCEAGLAVMVGNSNSSNITASTECSEGAFSVSIPLTGADGVQNLVAFQVDPAGNKGQDTRSFIRDTTAPNVNIALPLANSNLNSNSTFSGSCEAGLNVHLSGSVLNSATAVACPNGIWTLTTSISSGQGTKSLMASQTDPAGNFGQDQRNFQVDTIGPILSFTSPTAGSFIGATALIRGTCESGLSVQITGAGVASPATANCSNGVFENIMTISNPDGTKQINISQMDAAGNTGMASRSFVRDTLAPNLTISAPTNGSFVRNSVTLTGACEAGLTLSFSGMGLASNGSVICATNGSYSVQLNISPGDGPKTILASEADAAGNSSQASANYTKDTEAPLIAITSPAPNTQGQNGLTVSGSCESNLNVSLSGTGLANAMSTTCSSSGTFTSNILFSSGDGPKDISASQTDAANNTGSNTRTFLRNTTAPTLTISSPDTNSYVTQNFVLQGTCQAGLNVAVSGAGLSSGTSVPCELGAYSANLMTSSGDGIKSVTATQTDSIGNTGTASRIFRRDSTPPVLTILSPIYGTSIKASVPLTGACEPGLTVIFTGAGLSENQNLICPANGNYAIALTLSPGDGIKAITASETDPAGNSTSLDASYVNDTTGPAITITSPAPNTAAQTGVTVSGTCESGLNVTLNGSGISSPVIAKCENGVFSAPIIFASDDGPKSIMASQTDPLGNIGSATSSFLKDTVGPSITITSPAANSYLNTSFVLQGNCQAGLVVEISGPGIAEGGLVPCPNGSYSTTLHPSSVDGIKTVTASQTDSSGNTGTATRQFLLDTSAPTLTIATPANGSTVRSTFTLTGNCEAGLLVRFTGPGVSSESSTTCSNVGTYSINLTTSVGDGNKNVTVLETDAAGNTSQAVGNFNKDTTAPAILITSPASGTEGQAGLLIDGTCEKNLDITLSGAGLSAPVTTSCSVSGTFSSSVVFSNGEGLKPVTATQTDNVGNTASDSRTFVRDSTAPTLTISSPAANSFIAKSFTLQGTCQTGLTVHINGSGIQSATSVACLSSAYSASLTTSAGDGIKTVQATQTDSAGNTALVSRNFNYDSQGPSVSIASPAANSSVPPTAVITGTCESGLSVSINGDLTSSATGACPNGTYNITVTFTSNLGAKNVTASQMDAAGNSGQHSIQLMRDSNAGIETFIADASFGKIDILFVDDNSASMDPQQASLGTKFAGFASELINIDWQIGITTTDCSAGPYGICGSLLQMSGTNTDILTKTIPNFQTVFNNTIQRPETAGCLNLGTCPAGNSQPLLSATTAMTKHNTDNNGFFRSNSDLAIVILSDADEGQNSPALYSNRPTELVSTFNSIWTNGKKLSVYSIIVKPGDQNCLNQLTALNGGFSFFGTYIDQTVALTSGISTSICAPDYSVTLKSIGESVRTLTNSVELAYTPIADSVSVTLDPVQSITYKVIGKKVVFDSPPSVGTQIQVSYQHQ